MRFVKIVVPVLFTLAACGGSEKKEPEKEKPSGEKVLLRFKPQAGTVYDIMYTSEMSMPSIGDKTVSNLGVSLQVDTVMGNKAKMMAMFSHFDVETSSVGIVSTFNTDVDSVKSDPRLAAMFAPIIAIMKKNAPMLVDDRLNILKQPNFDSLVPKEFMVGNSTVGLDKSFEEFFIVWPEEELQEGSTWTRNMDIMEELQLSIKATYKVTKIDKEFVHLELKADIDSKEDRNGIRVTVKGNINGTSKVRRTDGWMFTSETALDLVVKTPGNEEKMSNRIKVVTQQ